MVKEKELIEWRPILPLPRTVTVHFPAKEDLLFGDDPSRQPPGPQIQDRVEGESILDALRGMFGNPDRVRLQRIFARR